MAAPLDGRRIALVGEAAALLGALEGAGAEVVALDARAGIADEDWHSGRYAALIAGSPGGRDERAVQLVREFLVGGKPIVVIGDGFRTVERAGGSREDVLQAGDAASLVQALADRFDDERLDEMSDMSFPASDPPAVSPSHIGRAGSADPDARA